MRAPLQPASAALRICPTITVARSQSGRFPYRKILAVTFGILARAWIAKRTDLLMCRNTLSLSDNEILDRVQQGERDAYAALFQRYYPRVEGYARRHLHNVEAARDVASETFLRAYRNVDRFRAGERITYFGYLLMICHRLILSEQARYATALARQRTLGAPEYALEQTELPLDRV